METKLSKKVINAGGREIGRRGDFILIRSRGRRNYTFGRLEGITYEGDVPTIELKGDSYSFDTKKVFGVEFYNFRKRPQIGAYRPCKYFDSRIIEEVISGIDNILTFLENHPDKRYSGHANLIRKIAEAQNRQS